jgi:phosphoserine phosphatase RsbU/P
MILNIVISSMLLAVTAFALMLFRKNRNALRQILNQKAIIENEKQCLTDSIYYAHRIQKAIITSETFFAKYLKDYFILYKPKDIVSGDFYASMTREGKFYFIVADCTGHGVPGAFMHLLIITILNKVFLEKNISRPDLILNEARQQIIKALNHKGSETRDGMDCVIGYFDFGKLELNYSASNNCFYQVCEGDIITHRADKMPVGLYEQMPPFNLYSVPFQQGDCFYFLTDGLPDQFGGPLGKKFKYKKLENLLLKNSTMPMEFQKEELLHELGAWQKTHEQVDDITVLGIRV